MATTIAELLESGVGGGIDSSFNRTYTATLQVIADKGDGPLTVLNAPGIPRWGSYYQYGNEFDLWSFSRDYKPTPKEHIKYDPGDGGGTREMVKWHVQVTYTTSPAQRSSNDSRQNPLFEPPKISGSFLGGTKEAIRNKDGALIVNTAGEIYDPSPTVADDIDTLLISFNTAYISLLQRANARGKVNSASIWGLDERMALLYRWDYEILYAGSMPFVSHRFEFHINYTQTPSTNVCLGSSYAGNRGWYTVLPNQGLAPLKTANTPDTKRRAKDDMDNPLTHPVKLKCDGTEETGTTERWNIFTVEEEFDFTTIPGMPNPLPGPFI